MRPARLPALLACLAFASGLPGCAPLPLASGAGADMAQDAPWPALLPLDQLLARQGNVTITPESNADLLARAAALRARAARLRARQGGG